MQVMRDAVFFLHHVFHRPLVLVVCVCVPLVTTLVLVFFCFVFFCLFFHYQIIFMGGVNHVNIS